MNSHLGHLKYRGLLDTRNIFFFGPIWSLSVTSIAPFLYKIGTDREFICTTFRSGGNIYCMNKLVNFVLNIRSASRFSTTPNETCTGRLPMSTFMSRTPSSLTGGLLAERSPIFFVRLFFERHFRALFLERRDLGLLQYPRRPLSVAYNSFARHS